MRASRLLQLLLLLQIRGRMTAPELARELEVSVRTVYRDIEALSAAGVPVYAEPGRNGGAQLVDGWRTRLTGLTGEEADTLPLLGMPGAAAELGLGNLLAATETKVLAALPPELRGRASRVQERFHLDAPGWYHRGEDVPHLAAVAAAVWDDRRVRVAYRRADQTVERTVDPLGLVLKAGTWYLVAAHRGQPRTYRVSRIEDVETLDARFERPAGFDLAAHWAESSREFERSLHTIEVELVMPVAALGLLRLGLEPGSERAASIDRGDDGWAHVRFPAESVDVALRQVLVLGADAEVLAPAELREAVAATAVAMAGRYDGSGRAPRAASTSRAATAR